MRSVVWCGGFVSLLWVWSHYKHDYIHVQTYYDFQNQSRLIGIAWETCQHRAGEKWCSHKLNHNSGFKKIIANGESVYVQLSFFIEHKHIVDGIVQLKV